MAEKAYRCRERLERHGRAARHARRVWRPSTTSLPGFRDGDPRTSLVSSPGATTTLRETLGRSLQLFNKASGGSLLTASADLLGSTSVSTIAAGFGPGYWNAATNPNARLLSIGGICEDAISGVLSGISAYGNAIGVGSSYGAFMAPLGHIAARLHAIGAQARLTSSGEPYRSLILVCAHAGLATGEDGPTHADPQALQLLRRTSRSARRSPSPLGATGGLALLGDCSSQRPALIAPFVTRPEVKVLDRGALGLAGPKPP